jgi:hypothetical protein
MAHHAQTEKCERTEEDSIRHRSEKNWEYGGFTPNDASGGRERTLSIRKKPLLAKSKGFFRDNERP